MESDWNNPGGGQHVDFLADESSFAGYRIANTSDGQITAELFYAAPAERSPEIRLLMAILQRAYDDILDESVTEAAKAHRRGAVNWIRRREDHPTIVEFNLLCDLLGLDPDYVRAGILKRLQPMATATGAKLPTKCRANDT